MICPLMVFVFVDHDYYDVCCFILRGVCDMLLCFPLGISAICELELECSGNYVMETE